MITKKICIFLPAPYRGGSMQGAKNIAKMLLLGSKRANEAVEIVFSCLKETYNINEEFSDLLALGIQVRETEWKIISKNQAQIALDFTQSEQILSHESYCIPWDGIKNFCDCDFWLIVSDRTSAPLLPIKPYGMIIYDYIQRYIPDIFGQDDGKLDLPFLCSARNASFILCTTPQTREDAIQYAGIDAHKVLLAPMEFNPLKYQVKPCLKKDYPYFIWTSNATQYKNHKNALKGLELYYEKLDGKFQVVMTGVQTELFQKKNLNQIPYIVDVRETIQRTAVLKNNLTILGELSESQYISVLSGAEFLFHPVLYDNGTFSVIEAAYHGVPSTSSNYPQMKYINERFNLNIEFFDPRKPQSIATMLKNMENNILALKENLPTKESLESHTYDKLSGDYWALVRNYL